MRWRLVAVGAIGVVALGLGLVCGASGDDPAQAVVTKFARAWTRGDYATMYAAVDERTRRRLTVTAFADAYRATAATATATGLVAGNPRRTGDGWAVPVFVRTRSFGPVTDTVVLRTRGEQGAEHIVWRSNLTFPGVPDGQTLTRTTRMPARADLLARDGTPLAKGASRAAGLGPVAEQTVGTLGPIPPDRTAQDERLGYPSSAIVGLTGLERVLDEQLAGTPGGSLSAGGRTLAAAAPRPAAPVRTTIDPQIEQAAITALGGRDGGVVVLAPKTGQVLAFAGPEWRTLQPPGSTFKIVTVTGALRAGIVKPSDSFPIETKAMLSGVALNNANGESCGGTLAQSFANSCNSVFGPLGAKLGAAGLYAQAVAFGFNRDPGLPGVPASQIPQPADLGDDLNVGSSAIGQGQVQATPVQMAWVAGAIADRGRLPRLTMNLADGSGPAPTTPVAPKDVALQVQRLMVGVVQYGTGTAAQIPGVKVAGKTGTAELRSTQPCDATDANPETCTDNPTTSDTDAWFTSYAPVGRPRVVVCVMLIGAGAGGDTAAPIAHDVLVAGLKATAGR